MSWATLGETNFYPKIVTKILVIFTILCKLAMCHYTEILQGIILISDKKKSKQLTFLHSVHVFSRGGKDVSDSCLLHILMALE